MSQLSPSLFFITPKYVIGFFWGWLFLRNALLFTEKDTFWIASFTSKIAYVVSPLFLLFMLFICIFEAHRFILKKYLGLIILFSLVFACFSLSVVANQPPLINVAQFLLGYLQFFILAPFIIICFDKEIINIDLIKKYLLIPLVIEFIINFFWFLGISPLPNQRIGGPDWAYGTLSAPQELAGISSILIFISMYWLMFKPDYLNRVKLIVAFGLLCMGCLQLIFADSKLTFMTVSIGLSIGCLIISKQRLSKKIILSFLSVIMICGVFMLNMVYQYHTRMKEIYQGQSNPISMLVRDYKRLTTAISYNPKIKIYSIVSNKLFGEIDFPFWGAGPGNATSRFSMTTKRPLAEKYITPQVDDVYSNMNNSYLYKPDSGFISIWGELGSIGVIFYYLTYTFLIWKVILGLKKGFFNHKTFESTIAFAFVCFGFYFLLHNFIKDIFYIGTEVAFFWITGTILYIILRNRETKEIIFKET